MKKILLSLMMIGVVGSLTVGATSAIFSDDETSTGNTFTAGAVDLTVDNESYYNGELKADSTWLASNLDDGQGPADGAYLFFNFDDIKPGDNGADAISLHVNDNDSWACVDLMLTSNDDNGITEPEGVDGDSTGGVGEGELADAIGFWAWADDGDSVFEDDETLIPLGVAGQLALNEPITLPLADSTVNLWGDDGALPGDSIRYIGKAFCLGDFVSDPVAQDGVGKTASSTNGPLERGFGYSCDGSSVDNVTQTDSMTMDISFHVEQSRHNGAFECQPLPVETTITVTKVVVNDTGSSTVEDFTLFVGGATTTSGEALTVLPGTYTVSETGPDGYDATFSGDCDANGEINIAEFEQLSCTITNSEVVIPMGQLTIDKLVSFTDPGLTGVTTADFTFTLTNASTSDETVFTDEVPQDLVAGDYVISESYTGSTSISYAATFVGDCAEIGTTDTATVTVDEDGVHTCQIFNAISDPVI